jgi:hypothetical protein
VDGGHAGPVADRSGGADPGAGDGCAADVGGGSAGGDCLFEGAGWEAVTNGGHAVWPRRHCAIVSRSSIDGGG